jgi:hypothetical protein
MTSPPYTRRRILAVIEGAGDPVPLCVQEGLEYEVEIQLCDEECSTQVETVEIPQ